ncbi:glyoxalase superfamily protein [Deinococcus soli (ex Cha et al. 2016)]|uniref:Uncharacterized protein n=2 Tax=Deinococcus soli (ex Cha et al. 2016) TaxID=1309411 RepID=A0ACC6KHC5_9DEIO|nr:glyoxalase superfamily protein [Deinococcus soli (ex Cha et al. 2016)]MDR6218857.1 hypothetical protein [Deinococcus soli (ex Cha et al. 2016)]MDR6328654.1 hypothetical protein [Deinococcus soli (ex Cha et al. 2016)]MDR6751859.1 hypothetical protein [Deinococcus soli (ex Cha et al. 2016)]
MINLNAQARRLKDLLAEQDVTLSHSEAQHLVARSLGYRDWQTAKAALPLDQTGKGRAATVLALHIPGNVLFYKADGTYLATFYTPEFGTAAELCGMVANLLRGGRRGPASCTFVHKDASALAAWAEQAGGTFESWDPVDIVAYHLRQRGPAWLLELPACGAAAAHVPSPSRTETSDAYGGNAVIQAVRLVGEIAQADFLTDGQYETLCETMSLEEREDVDALLWQISDLWDQVRDFTGRGRNDLERIRTFLADDLLNT